LKNKNIYATFITAKNCAFNFNIVLKDIELAKFWSFGVVNNRFSTFNRHSYTIAKKCGQQMSALS